MDGGVILSIHTDRLRVQGADVGIVVCFFPLSRHAPSQTVSEAGPPVVDAEGVVVPVVLDIRNPFILTTACVSEPTDATGSVDSVLVARITVACAEGGTYQILSGVLIYIFSLQCMCRIRLDASQWTPMVSL